MDVPAPPIKRGRGRPRKYATEEEAKAAQREKHKEYCRKYYQRTRDEYNLALKTGRAVLAALAAASAAK